MVGVEIFNDNDESNRKKLLKRIAKPNYENSVIFDDSQLVLVRMRLSTVLLNTPIHHGVPVLDRAKVQIYKWHYEYMIPKYGDKAKLCCARIPILLFTRSKQKIITMIFVRMFLRDLIRLHTRKIIHRTKSASLISFKKKFKCIKCHFKYLICVVKLVKLQDALNHI